MPHYLFQVAYTSDSWAKMLASPENRVEAVRPVIEGLGGKPIATFMTFGEYDIVAARKAAASGYRAPGS